MPDGIHLHSLIFRRVVQWAVGRKEGRALMRRNALTSPYLWTLSLMAVVPATLFWHAHGNPVNLRFIVYRQLRLALRAYCSIQVAALADLA